MVILGHFLPFDPPNLKILLKWKNSWRDHHFTQVYQKPWSFYNVPEIWQVRDVICIFHFGLFSERGTDRWTEKVTYRGGCPNLRHIKIAGIEFESVLCFNKIWTKHILNLCRTKIDPMDLEIFKFGHFWYEIWGSRQRWPKNVLLLWYCI